MGVSGFLISCAIRWATSCHAAAFCACSSPVKSSITNTKPGFERRGPSELTVTAARTSRPPAAISISREAAPIRSERRIRCRAARAASSPSRSGKRASLPGRLAENRHHGGIHARDLAGTIERNHARGNIFEDGFHQLAAAFALFHGLFEAARKLVDLPPPFAKLFGHAIERTDQRAQFVLRLHFDAVVEISPGNLARGLRERLDGHGYLLGKKQRDPGGGKDQQQSDERQCHQDLALIGPQVLLLLGVSLRL